MTKKLTWEVEKTSLVLKITDGPKETTWKIRKTTKPEDLRQVLEEMQLALWEPHMDNYGPIQPTRPMFEAGYQLNPEVVAELQGYQYYETSEEASRAAQAAEVRRLNIGAKWFETDDDETYGIPIPDYDSGEVRPR